MSIAGNRSQRVADVSRTIAEEGRSCQDGSLDEIDLD